MVHCGRIRSDLIQYDEWEHTDRPKFLGRPAAGPAGSRVCGSLRTFPRSWDFGIPASASGNQNAGWSR